ncbi:MAG: hypothetical protein RJA22_1449 [Verrucomicrobiota bacterium]|jgi:predicted dehydrogenase
MNTPSDAATDVSRREFLRGSAALLSLLGAVELKAAEAPTGADGKPINVPKVKLGIIGLGPHGRDIISTLQLLPSADIAALCDTYPAMVRRSANNVPGAKTTDDYRTLLEDKSIPAVLIATPTHQHKDIAIAALQAGKHVYCEAPLAHTIEDAKAIARAARDAGSQIFQAGLSLRADPHRHWLLQFIRSGAMGKPLVARAQWHKKQQWRFASPNPDREKEINWRLDKSISTGLAGELGIHQLDLLSWYLKDRPTAVTGFGGVLQWNDGRTVPDTAQAVLEYPGGTQAMWDATLGNSFDGEYEMFYGSDAAVMLRANKAWMFKEVDSPLLGWEVYARKDVFYKETGIALVANATKLVAQGENPVEDAPFANTPLYFALENFLTNVAEVVSETADFKETFGDDRAALAQHVKSLKLQNAAGWQEGLEAAVVAIKTNEAVTQAKRITFQKEWFDLA